MDFYNMQYLFASRSSCVLIKTQEPDRFIVDLKAYLNNELNVERIHVWSLANGMNVINNSDITSDVIEESPTVMPQDLFSYTKDLEGHNVVIIKDMQFLINTPNVLSALREYLSGFGKENKTIVFIAPKDFLCDEVEKYVDVVEYSTPDRSSIYALINEIASRANNSGRYATITEEVIDKCSNFAQGLTENEIKRLCSQSLIKDRRLNPDIFYSSRKKIIENTNILEIMDTNMTIEDLGGNEVFKEWLEEVKISMDEDAIEYNIPKSKGYLALGVPGTSKSLSAQIVAHEMQYPLYKLNMSKIMDSRVGQSEQNIEKAVNALKICSPCVLLIDEAEKTLSGNNSGVSDGGTMARVFGKILEFLASKESENVFTVMTSNDATSLPPELTRAGRLDCTWYFGLPCKKEREDILRIHLTKQEQFLDDDMISEVAENAKNLTGAEIKEIVKIATRKAFIRKKKSNNDSFELTIEDFLKAIDEINPVYISSKEKIAQLENYCKDRARHTSVKTSNKDNNSFSIEAFVNK